MLKIIEIAISQLGVQEDKLHTNHGEVIKYQKAAGLGDAGGYAWCQSFVYWCGLQAYGKAGNPIPRVGGVLNCLSIAKQKGYTIILKENATSLNIPIGAQFILKEKNGSGHTGLIESIDIDGQLHTIEGNSNDDGSRDGYKVCRQNKRNISDDNIIAYIVYNYHEQTNDLIV